MAHAGDFGLQPDNKSSVVQKEYIQYKPEVIDKSIRQQNQSAIANKNKNEKLSVCISSRNKDVDFASYLTEPRLLESNNSTINKQLKEVLQKSNLNLGHVPRENSRVLMQ